MKVYDFFSPCGTGDRFGRMVVFSLFVHVIFSAALLASPKGRSANLQVHYLDLKMSRPAPTEEIQKTSAEPAHKKAVSEEASKTPESAAPTEIEKLRQAVKNSVEAASVRPENYQKASFGLGIFNGRFSSISDGRTLRNDMREYYLSMLAKFNENWWKKGDMQRGTIQGAVFMVTVARDGSIVDITLTQNSGNPVNDRLMAQSLKSADPLSPLPTTYESDFFTAPIRFVAPLNLMAP